MSVPKYRLDAIETIGRKILQEYDPALLDGPPQAVPIETIIETKFDLTLEYHCLRKNGSILGETIFDEGAAILYDQDEKRYRLIAVKAGTILVEERLCVDRLLGRLRFTCAHELGHWVLHQKLYSGTGDVAAYGYRLAGRDLEIIPEEAEVVRRIFSAYLSGQGKDDIARELNQIGVDRGRNREKWHPSTVAYILTNITYTGDMIWQKSCATDTIPFRQVRNLGQKPRYFVEHSHPAIVSCADFQRVQELMSSRKEQFQRAHCTKKGSLYDKHIYCGECGSLCRKKITGGKTYWVCRRHDGDRANCPIPQIPEPEITAAVLRLYHKLKFGQETVLRPALSQLQELRERELRSNRKISDIDNEIARISEQNLVLVRLKSKGYVDSALYLSQMDEIDHKLRELRKLRRRLLEAAGEDRQIHDTERMMEYLEDGPEWLDEVPSDLFGELLDRIIIISPERLKFRLLNGMELSENIERMVR